MSLAIAAQLSGLYQELIESRPFSDTVGFDLSRAGARGCLLHLAIGQCHGDDDFDPLFLGFVVHWFVCDSRGFRPDEHPWEGEGTIAFTDEWMCLHPFVRFSTDGHRVRFGMALGPQWYVVRQGPLGPDGRFDPATLTNYSSKIWC